MGRRALIVVDNPHREMRGMVGVWKRLWSRGISTHIVSKTSFNDWFALLRPDVVILPRATSEMMPFIRAKKGECSIVVIPSEHGAGFRQKVLINAFGSNYFDRGEYSSAIDDASLILVGGENQKRWLLEEMPELDSRIRIVGTLSSDHWLKPRTPSNRGSGRIGVCTTFKSMLLSTGTKSVHKLFHTLLHNDFPGNRWRLQFQNYEFEYLSHVLEAIDRMVASGYSVDIRPHPHEYVRGWRALIRSLPPQVTINRDVDVARWIDSTDACITSFSTMGIDCVARGVPSISLERFLPEAIESVPAAKAPLLSEYSWKPNNLAELDSLLRQAVAGELQASPDPHAAEAYMRKNFHWPREESSATLCANAVIDLLHAQPAAKGVDLNAIAKFPKAIAKIIAKELRDYRSPRRDNLLFSIDPGLWIAAYRYNQDIVV